MLVDNKAYTGEHMTINGRATFVLVKQPSWKIVHIHLSKIDQKLLINLVFLIIFSFD